MGFILPNPEEDAKLTTSALNDLDAPPLNAAQLNALRPVQRPLLSIRIDPDLLEHLRALGPGWQARVHAGLRQLVAQRAL